MIRRSGDELRRTAGEGTWGRWRCRNGIGLGLREMEEHTLSTDPDFVTRLDLAGALRRRRRLRRVCWWLLALGAWLMLMGLSTAHGVISGGALTAGGGCALVLWPALTARGLRVSSQRP